jgi:parvulin-like peptidyl-prolyl isomerase
MGHSFRAASLQRRIVFRRGRMSVNWRSLIASAALILMLTPQAGAELVDGIVATVDTEVILHSDLMSEAGPFLAELRTQGLSQEQMEREARKIMREALDQAIEQRILYREGLLAGLNIPDDLIEERLNRIRRQYGAQAEFDKMLQEMGATVSEFREQLKKQMIAIAFGMRKRDEFQKDAVVAESDLRQYYQDNIDEYMRPKRVRAYRIFLAAGDGPEERARVRARLESLRDEIALGASFSSLAEAHSEGPDASGGGLIGWVMPNDLVPELDNVLFSLDIGQVSQPTETEFGYHLLMVEAKEEAGMASFSEVRNEIEPILRAKYAEERYSKWIAELRKRSRVRVFL